MSGDNVLPLFVLPMVILPGEIQQLRIFEPRYRQMLDDCLLEQKSFGLVCDDEEKFNGWRGPRNFGCEVEIIHHETMGSNHFVEIIGTRKFQIDKVIEPALPPFSDQSMAELMPEVGIYPDLETILEQIPEDGDYHKLYLAAEVSYLENEFTVSEEQLEALTSALKSVIKSIGNNINVEHEILDEWVESRVAIIVKNDSDTLYSIASMTISDLEKKYEILSQSNSQEIYDEIMTNLTNIA
jgi:Lon protease-like protein